MLAASALPVLSTIPGSPCTAGAEVGRAEAAAMAAKADLKGSWLMSRELSVPGRPGMGRLSREVASGKLT